MNATVTQIAAPTPAALVSSIDIDPKVLTSALKAVRAFVSKDQTRYILTHILAETVVGFVKFTATDGHTLCSVNVPCKTPVLGESALLGEMEVDTLLLCAKGAKHALTCIVSLNSAPSVEAKDFPQYERVIPVKAEAGATGPRVHGFDGQYLARIGTVQKALGATGATIQLGAGENSPMRADIQADGVTATVVIMPRRI